MLAAIGIGSNIGDRQRHISAAVASLSGLEETSLLCVGPIVETEPVGPPEGERAGAAAAWEPGGRYLNTAAVITTMLPARALLVALHEIERTRGRDRAREQRWGPRTLDLDLLLYGLERISEAGLTVPHPRMSERMFVLGPLCEIAPHMVVPGVNRVHDTTVEKLRDALAGGVRGV